jgi:hypothetical protein
MYRVYAGAVGNQTPYYRCYGSGPQRKGCGNMVPVAELDAVVTEAMQADQMNAYVERVFIAGNDQSSKIGKLRQQAVDAYTSGNKALFMELDAQADQLDALESVSPHWEERETDQTLGQHFAALDMAGKREYLASRYEVRGYRLEDGTTSAGIFPRAWELAA